MVMVKSKQLMDAWMDDGWMDFMNISWCTQIHDSAKFGELSGASKENVAQKRKAGAAT